MEKLVAHGGFDWQMFGNRWLSATPPSPGDCSTRMRELCAPTRQHWPMLMYGPGGPTWGWNHTARNTTLAAFLISRPPHAWVGYSVEDARLCGLGASASCWDPVSGGLPVLSFILIIFRCVWEPEHQLFDMDVGKPVGLCEEDKQQPGVFTRRWTKGIASIDCASFTASLPFKLKQSAQLQGR